VVGGGAAGGGKGGRGGVARRRGAVLVKFAENEATRGAKCDLGEEGHFFLFYGLRELNILFHTL
jgi:hypothetical protein